MKMRTAAIASAVRKVGAMYGFSNQAGGFPNAMNPQVVVATGYR